jgi:hypothetical protein
MRKDAVVVGEEGRPAAGGIAAAWNASQMPGALRSETSKPSIKSSPWILGAPQSAFSAARRRIRVRICSLIRGRHPRDRDRQRQ